MPHIETTIAERTIYEGKVFTVKERDILLENGQKGHRELVFHKGACAVLPIDSNNDVYLVEQFRSPFQTTLLELPAGKLEVGENPLEGVKRELEEETGLVAQNYIYIGEYLPTVAFCNERIHLYIATDLEMKEKHLDEDEFLTDIKMPFNKAYQMCIDGEIKDGKTLVALMKAKAVLGL